MACKIGSVGEGEQEWPLDVIFSAAVLRSVGTFSKLMAEVESEQFFRFSLSSCEQLLHGSF